MTGLLAFLARPVLHDTLRVTPLRVPQVEAFDVKLEGLVATDGDPLHDEPERRDLLFASVADLTSAWTTPHTRDMVVRQASVRELVSNEGTESNGFHDGPFG